MSGRMWSICWTFPPGGNRRGNRKNHDNRFSPLLFFSVPTERAAIANGNDLRGLGICHQQAFSRNSGYGISAKYAILRKIALLANLLSSEKRSIMFVGGATMDYITTKEVATNWGISDRRVLQYCNADRIEGAIKIGNMWLIPKTAEKPIDGRTRKGGRIKNEKVQDFDYRR